MGTADITRLLLHPAKHYVGARLQRGRVVTDSDFNERQLVEAEDVRATLIDVIGPKGTPDDGFRIFDPVSVDVDGAARLDFSIDSGVMYLGGHRIESEQVESARHQRDWLQRRPDDLAPWPVLAGTETRTDLIYLEVLEETVTAREDRELLDPALGGADTSTRLRLGRRVRVLTDVGTTSCAEAFGLLSDAIFDQSRYRIDSATCALVAVDESLRLSLETVPPEAAAGPCPPCDPDPQGPFLGADHRAIRVMVTADAQAYTWGFDNAAPLYRVHVDAGGTVTFLDRPADSARHPRPGEIVEVLGWSRLLPNGEKIATRTGFITRAATAFDPASGQLMLEQPLPADALVTAWPGHPDGGELPGAEGLTYYLRVWDRGPIGDTPPEPLLPIVSGALVPLGTTGLGVRWSGGVGRPGDAWVIAHRPVNERRTLPWVISESPQPAVEPRRYVAPLALVTWRVEGTDVVVDRVRDCRSRFGPLTCGHGCTLTVGGKGTPAAGNFTALQAAIDALPASGGRICVMPGEYDGRFVLRGRANVEIVGCGPWSRLVIAMEDGNAAPLGFLCDCQDVRIADLVLEPRGVAGIQVGEDEAGGTARIVLEGLRVQAKPWADAQASPKSAIELTGGEQVTVRRCRLEMPRGAPSLHPIAYLSGRRVDFHDNVVECTGLVDDGRRAWGGVQIGGNALDVRVRDNEIRGGFGHGITLGSIAYEAAKTATLVPVGCAAMSFILGLDPRLSLEVLYPFGSEAGAPLPTPAGALEGIVLRGNLIEDQGGSGISVPAFWPVAASGIPDVVPGASDVIIEDNRIVQCLLETPLEASAEPSLMAGGGICLGDVDGLRVVGNVIRDCAPGRAGCGVFVALASEATLERNVIEGVGAPGGIGIGASGGVVLYSMLPSVGLRDTIPAAAQVVGNRVQQPSGRALQITTIGGMLLVSGNELGSRGDDSPSPTLCPTSLQVQAGRVNDGAGLTIDLLNAALAYDLVTATPPGTSPVVAGAFDDGRILFTGNQVTLDWDSRTARGPFLASVRLHSLDEVAVVGNEFVAKLDAAPLPTAPEWPVLTLEPWFATGDILLTHVYALGASVKIDGNRITEGVSDALISALGIGIVDLSTMARFNHATHCVVAQEASGSTVDPDRVLNHEVINPNGVAHPASPFCDTRHISIDPLDGTTSGTFGFFIQLDSDTP